MAASDSTTTVLKCCNRKENCIHPDNRDGYMPADKDHFYRDQNTVDGFQRSCKECHKAVANNWSANNRERTRANAKNWRTNNAEQDLKNHLARKRKYPVEFRARHHRWEAKRRNLPATLTAEQWRHCLEYFEGRCAYCGEPPGLWNMITMDHYIPFRAADCLGTVAENVLPCCMSCNSSKGHRDAEAWAKKRFGKAKAKAAITRIRDYFASLAAPD